MRSRGPEFRWYHGRRTVSTVNKDTVQEKPQYVKYPSISVCRGSARWSREDRLRLWGPYQNSKGLVLRPESSFLNSRGKSPPRFPLPLVGEG